MSTSLMTAEKVASRLGVSTQRVYDMVRKQLIPVVRLGRQIRINEQTLEQWIESGGMALPGGWRRV
ncbi:Helix-turn-helix domain protein [compost metagenome]